MSKPADPVDLAARLIRCPSVTPEEGGALALLAEELSSAGFDCRRVDRNGVSNLFARWGPKGHERTFGFNGHTDVVPPGDRALWSKDPFGGDRSDGLLWGRGAVDMKSGVAAFAAAAADFVREAPPPDGAVVMAITGDEEAEATDGTVALLGWMEAEGERMSVCLVGEPTSSERLGDAMKIGRRGSLTAYFEATGVQGHSAYPGRARNPVHAIARLADRLASDGLDKGTEHFPPSTLSVVSIDTGNPAANVIPAHCRATVNIRFNDAHGGEELRERLRREAKRVAEETETAIEMTTRISGESFLTPPGTLSELVAAAIEAETGVAPELSTAGGTSDARFVKDHCPVVEFGLVGETMHQADERVPEEDVLALKRVYRRILESYFA